MDPRGRCLWRGMVIRRTSLLFDSFDCFCDEAGNGVSIGPRPHDVTKTSTRRIAIRLRDSRFIRYPSRTSRAGSHCSVLALASHNESCGSATILGSQTAAVVTRAVANQRFTSYEVPVAMVWVPLAPRGAHATSKGSANRLTLKFGSIIADGRSCL